MAGVKLDERILRHFKIGIFIGVRKSSEGLHTAFFIKDKEADFSDLGTLIGGLRLLPDQIKKAYREMLQAAPKEKKRRRRKKATQ